MQKILLLILLVTAAVNIQAQSFPKDTVPPGSALLAYYEGRTACQELMAALDMPPREECIKRKMVLMLYVDKVTMLPTLYRIIGLGTRSGTGKWSVEKGVPDHPQATVYRLDMGDANMFLLKGDEQVLFILDKQRNPLVGNAKFSYTLNRVTNQHSWERWRELVHKGKSF